MRGITLVLLCYFVPRTLGDIFDAKLQDDIEERLKRLEDLVKVATLRSCNEYAHFGLKTSGTYMIDPDGSLIGKEPFQVFCDFSTGATEVMHNSEDETEVEHCHDAGCYQKNISYVNGQSQEELDLSQIVSLIELSDYCEQKIDYNCFLAPLFDSDINYGFWEDRHQHQNIYFTG